MGSICAEIVGIWICLAVGTYIWFYRTWSLAAILGAATAATLLRVFWLQNVGTFKRPAGSSKKRDISGREDA
jgi:low affinity Fe/Cu permease